jgi:TetR/AcrR family transcriptional repressor of nem operon
VSKGDETRERIIARAAPLFNQRGYAGAAMSDIMAATGLEKGGIYRHFGSKESLALASFDYATRVLTARFESALAGKERAIDRVEAVLELWRTVAEDPPIAGGCHAMNTAIESDDTHPALRDRARRVLRGLESRLRRILEDGIAGGELRASLDARRFAAVIVATLEGALMLTRLHGDTEYMRRATAHLAESLTTYSGPTRPGPRRHQRTHQ